MCDHRAGSASHENHCQVCARAPVPEKTLKTRRLVSNPNESDLERKTDGMQYTWRCVPGGFLFRPWATTEGESAKKIDGGGDGRKIAATLLRASIFSPDAVLRFYVTA